MISLASSQGKGEGKGHTYYPVPMKVEVGKLGKELEDENSIELLYFDPHIMSMTWINASDK